MLSNQTKGPTTHPYRLYNFLISPNSFAPSPFPYTVFHAHYVLTRPWSCSFFLCGQTIVWSPIEVNKSKCSKKRKRACLVNSLEQGSYVMGGMALLFESLKCVLVTRAEAGDWQPSSSCFTWGWLGCSLCFGTTWLLVVWQWWLCSFRNRSYNTYVRWLGSWLEQGVGLDVPSSPLFPWFYVIIKSQAERNRGHECSSSNTNNNNGKMLHF